MFDERRQLLREIFAHYKALADQLKVKTMVDEETMVDCCPSTEELINIGVPGEACGQDKEVIREVDKETGETKISIQTRPGVDDYSRLHYD